MEVHCVFEDIKSDIDNENYFVCGVKDQKILENHDLKFIGKHEVGRSKYDVTSIYFHNCEVTKVPQGLTKIFPNLTTIDIRISNLKNLCRNDLIEYKNLKEFRCYLNQIEFLPGDLFEDFKNLELISFYGNHLKIIEPNFLDGLSKLKFVDLRENLNFNKWFSTLPHLKGNISLDELKTELLEKFFTQNSNLVKDFCLRLQLKVQNFRECKDKLVEKNLRLKTKYENSKNEKSTLTLNFQNQIDDLTSKLETGLLADLKASTKDETSKDLIIFVNDRVFKVHKFLIVARSPALAEILKNNLELDNLNLVNITEEIFEKILKYLYTDELPGDDQTNYLHLFATAGKLKIEELKNHAATKLFDLINETNALNILEWSNKYDHKELRQKAFEEIKKKYPKLEFKDEWSTQFDKLLKIIQAYVDKQKAEKTFEEALTQE